LDVIDRRRDLINTAVDVLYVDDSIQVRIYPLP
jgi:hypothetical protein